MVAHGDWDCRGVVAECPAQVLADRVERAARGRQGERHVVVAAMSGWCSGTLALGPSADDRRAAELPGVKEAALAFEFIPRSIARG